MLGNWNVEWLNLNSQRKYPLADDASALSDDDGFTIPDEFIVELDLAIHAGMDVNPGRFFIKHVSAYGTGFMVVVGYQPVVGDAVTVATATIAEQFHSRNKVYALGGVEPFDDAVGKIVIGKLDNIKNEAAGMHTFEFESARLDPDAIRPMIRGLSSIVVVNNGQRSRPFYGDIELVAGTNMLIVPTQVEDETPIVTFNAIKGEGTIDDCECIDDDAVAPPIKTINGIAPTSNGDFTIVGEKCIEVNAVTNGVQLNDSCVTPCCGCPELEILTRELERLKREADAVSRFADRLQSATDFMDRVVLGSKIGGGCNP